MLLIERDSIRRFVASIGPTAELLTDGDLSSKTDNANAYFVGDQGVDSLMDIAGVGGEKGAEDDEDFSRAVTRCVEESSSGHLEAIL